MAQLQLTKYLRAIERNCSDEEVMDFTKEIWHQQCALIKDCVGVGEVAEVWSSYCPDDRCFDNYDIELPDLQDKFKSDLCKLIVYCAIEGIVVI